MPNKALLVGINDYPSAPLRGCINDVKAISGFLVERCGFQAEEIRLLVDRRATRAAIIERLRWLTWDLRAGDRVVFHYSGHGSRLPRRNADGKIIEIDDVICPVDFDFTPGTAITDDDFREIFEGIPEGVALNWVSDSCHSGDLARDFYSRNHAIMNKVPRAFPMPADIAWGIASAMAIGLVAAVLGRSIAEEHLHGAFISGCRSDQTSADAYIGGHYCGACTHYLLETLGGQDGMAQPLTRIVGETNRKLEANGYEQDPQLRGDPEHTAKPWLGA